jgi:hypothetical protein
MATAGRQAGRSVMLSRGNTSNYSVPGPDDGARPATPFLSALFVNELVKNPPEYPWSPAQGTVRVGALAGHVGASLAL